MNVAAELPNIRSRAMPVAPVTFPGKNDSAPDLTIVDFDAERRKNSYSCLDVLAVVEVPSEPEDEKDYIRNVQKEPTLKRRSLAVAAALTATAALFLTACGSGDEKSSANDKVAGAEQGTATLTKPAEPSAAAAEVKSDGVDVSLPKDINLVFDWTTPTDKNEAAAMDDAANYIRAIYHGVDKRTSEDAAVIAYSTGGGLHYAETQIDSRVEGGWTATGTRRHYQTTTRSAANGNSVEVTFCVDSSKFYGKEVKTGKVLKSTPSIADYDHFKIVMVKFPTSDHLWQASKVLVETKATKCQ